MPPLHCYPCYFRDYHWEKKHPLFGYPEDNYPNFEWILSLEKRFNWLRYHCHNTASIYLIREVIQWGGSQNGVLQKFDDGAGEINLQAMLIAVVNNLANPALAIQAALALPGMGLTYASKLLRFLDPDRYGALDNRLRGAFFTQPHPPIPQIHDNNVPSMVAGYTAYAAFIEDIVQQLESAGINRPICSLPRGANNTGWRAADVEMALFRWAELGGIPNGCACHLGATQQNQNTGDD